MFFSYPNFISVLNFGATEGSVRFPVLIYFFLILLIIFENVKNNKILIGTGSLLILIFNSFYSTWHPFFGGRSCEATGTVFATLSRLV